MLRIFLKICDRSTRRSFFQMFNLENKKSVTFNNEPKLQFWIRINEASKLQMVLFYILSAFFFDFFVTLIK